MPILISQIFRENYRNDGLGHGRNGPVRLMGNLAEKTIKKVARLHYQFCNQISATKIVRVINGLQKRLQRLQVKVKSVQPIAKSLKTFVVAEVAQVAYIYMYGGIETPHIYESKRRGECQKSERLLLLPNWCTSYPGRTRTHPYGVSGCPVRGTSNNY